MKRLAIFVDGTWNVAHNNTNVWRLKLLTATADDLGAPQRAHYHLGVGTGRTNRIRGAFGKGINASVRNCYEWLLDQYSSNDDIFIFGFSRGAFIARSLAGFIDRCGLLRPGTPLSVEQVFERYRNPAQRPSLEEIQRSEPGLVRRLPHEDRTFARYSRRVPIRFLGLWDTVRYHDLPLGSIRGVSRSQNIFHVIQASESVQRVCQALAIDEHRQEYRPEVWRMPSNSFQRSDVEIEQRWFAGAHSNVGGGYTNDTMAVVPLAWMQTMAGDCGLAFRDKVVLHDDEHVGPVRDSFREFLGGAYRVLRLNHRYFREIGARAEPSDHDRKPDNTYETIDATVFDRWRRVPDYRPPNLLDWAARQGIGEISELYGTVSAVDPLSTD